MARKLRINLEKLLEHSKARKVARHAPKYDEKTGKPLGKVEYLPVELNPIEAANPEVGLTIENQLVAREGAMAYQGAGVRVWARKKVNGGRGRGKVDRAFLIRLGTNGIPKMLEAYCDLPPVVDPAEGEFYVEEDPLFPAENPDGTVTITIPEEVPITAGTRGIPGDAPSFLTAGPSQDLSPEDG